MFKRTLRTHSYLLLIAFTSAAGTTACINDQTGDELLEEARAIEAWQAHLATDEKRDGVAGLAYLATDEDFMNVAPSPLDVEEPVVEFDPYEPVDDMVLPSDGSLGTIEAGCGEPGSGSFCSTTCRCEIGEGDCDTNAECVDGAVCQQQAGTDFCVAEPGPACANGSGNHDSAPGTVSYCTPGCTCNPGEGDCDVNADCEGSAICFQQAGTDYCGYTCAEQTGIHPSAPNASDYCSSSCTCNAGEGDCDSDADCAAGTYCLQQAGTDVCTAFEGCHQAAPNASNYCTTSCTCDVGEGDCDSNAECSAGSYCQLQAGLDVCVADAACAGGGGGTHTGTPGWSSYCTPGCPCAFGEGDCDTDADCDAGLTCVQDSGAMFGFAPITDVCQ